MQLRFPGRIAGAIGILVALCAPASANDLCITLDTSPYFANTSIPGKNQCKSLYLLAEAADGFPGFLANGAICLSSDGTTVLFNAVTGYFGEPETVQGTWVKSTGLGIVSDCTASGCGSAIVTVTSCKSQSIPAAVFDPFSVLVKSSMSG